MSWFAWSLVIFLTALAAIGGPAWWMGRRERVPLARLADPAPLPGELPIAGYFDLPEVLCAVSNCLLDPDRCFRPPCPRLPAAGPYGPFPVDTGPLLILSEQAAANVALEREIRQQCAEAEAKIPPRWR